MNGPIRGIFLLEETLRHWNRTEALLARAADAGITAVFTETVSFPHWLPGACHRRGLDVIAGVACYSDHAAPLLHHRPQLWPIDATGARRPTIEWYTGLIPTDPAYNEELVARCVDLVANHDADGLSLDFIRWPLHWELELRASCRDAVRACSFDPTTVRDFTARTGIPVPTDDARAAAVRIMTQHENTWTDYRCQVITDVVDRIANAVRSQRPDLWIGAFIVPALEDDRRSLVGQSVADLQNSIDAFLPMTYHAILQQQPDFPAVVVDDVRRHTRKEVIPVIQTTADPAIAGNWDWGDRFDPTELAAALGHALRASDGNAVLFPAEGLDDARWAAVEVFTNRAPRIVTNPPTQ